MAILRSIPVGVSSLFHLILCFCFHNLSISTLCRSNLGSKILGKLQRRRKKFPPKWMEMGSLMKSQAVPWMIPSSYLIVNLNLQMLKASVNQFRIGWGYPFRTMTFMMMKHWRRYDYYSNSLLSVLDNKENALYFQKEERTKCYHLCEKIRNIWHQML